ncbi:AAA family ATPase [Aquimarina sp. Aq78]|uniref:AAA family ATPase n=1 Tax=Aquimarina sp. Aq78 TaxID=1191889 RepID=UPI000D10DC25|nr:AAA family ATPase [Aquimarina sp. Aq78]
MKIHLLDSYKSLKPFESEELSKLTIITGENGSGKSQLLDLIGKNFKKDKTVSSIRIDITPSIDKIQVEGLVKNGTTQVSHDQWKTIVKKQLDLYKQLTTSGKELLKYIIDKNLQSKINSKNRNQFLSTESDYLLLIKKNYTEQFNTTLDKLSNLNYNHQNSLLNRLYTTANENVYLFINELCKLKNKAETELTEADFYSSPIQENLIDSGDLFSSQVELIFYNYAKRRDINRKDFFYKKEEGEDNNSISDVDFITKFTPPWDLINEIFAKHNINFHFKGIDKRDFTLEAPIDFKLYKKSTDTSIPFIDLSSGEKIIIGLIIKLFTTEYYGNLMKFPDLLILDEPDAHLHPEMSKLLLDVLKDTFVEKFNINIILTTHSPSTIALSEESNIFQLRNESNSGLKKISKNQALKILTNFIPTLTIDYKNHRQIFVESPTDVNYFQGLQDKHLQFQNLPYKLYFISNSAGKSNCSQVYKIVKEIRDSGNLTSFGIVDWDLKNKPTDFVFVHGLGQRYSVENFILDPIYIISLLIEMKNAHNICDIIGVDNTYNQYLIGDESSEKLQEYSNCFFEEFEKKFPAYKADSEKTSIEYLNKREINIPNWFLKMQGHEIVEKVKLIFPALNKYSNEGDIQNTLSFIMTKCYPFVPKDTITTFENINNCG